jgi:hypothetical protein
LASADCQLRLAGVTYEQPIGDLVGAVVSLIIRWNFIKLSSKYAFLKHSPDRSKDTKEDIISTVFILTLSSSTYSGRHGIILRPFQGSQSAPSRDALRDVRNDL